MVNHLTRDELEIRCPFLCRRSSEAFDEADNDVVASLPTPMTFIEHGNGLSDPCSRT
jgi:hypothetical protein